MSDCLFCKIVSGEIPSLKIYEDEKYLAFLDVFPMTKGHTLVIPKKHYAKVWDVKEVGEYFEIVRKIALEYRVKTGNEVRSMIYGEQISHAHIHLFPFNGKWNEAISNINPEQMPTSEGPGIQETLHIT
ncbi:HIT domain-containing protein [Candidatus Dojkabacteria bacterium]|uniref:HIT domain-containing protein n=1 Tax=Candidatus Dojkabacteria bacterium TaxID=2099670 RepID=A0A955L8V0_9BACT|nr:HIT domain-containing protein [Candidatus Dojkabacteria bacterium]